MYMKQFLLLPYTDALASSRVLNINELNSYIWVQIPTNLSPYVILSDMQDMSTTPATPIIYDDKVSRDNRNCWMKIDLSILSTEAGLHVYRFVFNNTITGEDTSLYFAYQIQNDAPEKPYIYMNRGDAS